MPLHISFDLQFAGDKGQVGLSLPSGFSKIISADSQVISASSLIPSPKLAPIDKTNKKLLAVIPG